MIFKVETKQGVLPYEFATQQEAKDYVMAFLSWSGTKYRIIVVSSEAGVPNPDPKGLEASIARHPSNLLKGHLKQ
jgi:hypothetical protein